MGVLHDWFGVRFLGLIAMFNSLLHALDRVFGQQLQNPDVLAGAGQWTVTLLEPFS